MRVCLSVLALVSVAACSSTSRTVTTETIGTPTIITTGGELGGGFPTPPEPEPEVIERNGLADQLQAIDDSDILTRSNSRFDAIPQSGSADFSGVLAVTAFSSPRDSFTAIAETDITADFGAATLSAETGTFLLFDTDLNPVGEMDGSIDLTNGEIAARRPNSVDFNIAGTVSHPIATIGIDGTLQGAFVGSPEIRGITADEGASATTLNGVGALQTGVELAVLPNE